ncbi:GmrSD restriction endonuclease domain-containing protein [Streptomyces swartbergensis]|uniref:GmrSD restriction endonucleases N-terminal domain-containing protein n=1 Tax=Streptomyces swartbergensis TaxID=487165 RepID=A0A243S264_9ACTN|nr:DUF262 domain-containing protein [Streptomyces swartbergensis]OUD01627.1 hypothetical protein CA983_19170 [Streptomyces swartbergensis]
MTDDAREEESLPDYDLEDEESDEEEDSEEKIFRDITTYTVDWTSTTVMERMLKGAIDVSPPYQRHPVWNQQKIWRFLESLMLGIPVPQLVLATKRGAKGKFVVLDGKQRLLAIKFAADLNSAPTSRKFPKLEILSDFQGKNLEQVLADDNLAEYWENLLVQPIRTVVVQGYSDDRALHSIFHRLNQNSVSLSSHELRRALNFSPFMDWLDHFSADSMQVRRARRIPHADFRMRDAEMVLRHFAFARRFGSYRGNLRAFLDEEAKSGGKHWPSLESNYAAMGNELNAAIDASFDIFGAHSFFRFTPNGYIKRFNAPLFDVMTASLRVPEIRHACYASDRLQLKRSMEELCVLSPFAQYVTSTTKSTEAVRGRFQLWSKMIGATTSLDEEYVLDAMTGGQWQA